MKPFRLDFLVVVGFCLLQSGSLYADDIVSPFGPTQQFSADMVIKTDKGQDITQKIYSDNGKVRSEMTANGMQIVSILRPDQQKIYEVMVEQKMVMEMPYDPERYKKMVADVTGPHGKFELVGPDTVDGIACIKYKVMEDKENKVYFLWADAATKAPVKVMAADNSVTMLWKNYKAGPQDASLFVPPSDYKVMSMLAMPNIPGGAGQ